MAKRHWIIGGILALAIIKGLSYLNLARNLEFVPKLRVHKVNLGGIQLAVDLKILNPTKQKASFTKPFVGIYLDTSLIGYQDAGQSTTEIQPQGSTETTVIINVPYSLQLAQLLQTKPRLRVKVVSYVDNKQLEVAQDLSLSGLAFNTLVQPNQNHGGIS